MAFEYGMKYNINGGNLRPGDCRPQSTAEGIKKDGDKNNTDLYVKVTLYEEIEDIIRTSIKEKHGNLTKVIEVHKTDSYELYDVGRFSKENGTYLYDTYNYYKV